MQGEKAVAVGLSLTLHACVAWMVLARLAIAPGLLPGPSVRVSIEAPALLENPAATVPSAVMRPSGDAPAALAAAAPSAIAAVAAMPSAPAAAEAQALKAIDAAESRPLANESPSPTQSAPAAPLQALAPDAIVATQSPPDATPLAADVPMAPATLGMELLHAAPALASKSDLLGLTLPEQAATGVLPSNAVPAEPAAPSQPLAIPAAPSPLPTEATAPKPQPAAAPVSPTADAAPSTSDRPVTPPNPVIASAGLQAMTDDPRTQSASAALATDATLAPLGPIAPQQNTVSASLASPEQGTAIDLDAEAAPAPPDDAALAQHVRAFVDRYDGGPCFFATVRRVSAAGADIESFSATPDTFTQFDRALKRATGIEPVVSGQRIWSAQCAAVDVLRQLPRPTEAAPILDLARRDLHAGETLSGTIRGTNDRTDNSGLGLFVISESGAVTDVSDALSEHSGTAVFSFRPPPPRPGGPFPQILVLMAGPAPLPHHPESIEALFKPLIAAKGIGFSVAAKMFLVAR